MKYLIILFSLFIVSCTNSDNDNDQQENNSRKENTKGPIRFDGIYATEKLKGKTASETYYYYLRFYDDGTVIGVTTSGTPDQIKDWFKKGSESVSKGEYTITGDSIEFIQTHANGQVEYTGTIINQEELELHSKSDNGNERELTYTFVED